MKTSSPATWKFLLCGWSQLMLPRCLMHRRGIFLLTFAAAASAGCSVDPPLEPVLPSGVLHAGFVALETVYNSELMAPYDVLQHSVFRDSANYIRPSIISPDGKPFTTFEGIRIVPHYSFASAPAVDILVIPSTAHSMGADLANDAFLAWLRTAVGAAQYVITVCDGAFPLAATGLADDRMITTFPADRDRLAALFPRLDVQYDVNLAVDGKFITSVGGARSYEPALYLVEVLYGTEHARRTAEGLVLDWNLSRVPYRVAR